MQDCSNSIALAMELLQSCIKPLKYGHSHIDGLVQGGSISSALTMEILQSYTKVSIYSSTSSPSSGPFY